MEKADLSPPYRDSRCFASQDPEVQNHNVNLQKEQRKSHELNRGRLRMCPDPPPYKESMVCEDTTTQEFGHTGEEIAAARGDMRERKRSSLTTSSLNPSKKRKPDELVVKTIEIDVGTHLDCLEAAEFGGLTAGLTMSSGPQHEQGKLIGPTMELEPLLLGLAPEQTTSNGHRYRNFNGTSFLFNADATQATQATERARFGRLEKLLGPLVPELVKTYQKTVQPSLPVVESKSMSDKDNNIEKWHSVLLTAICSVSEPWMTTSDSISGKGSLASNLEDLAFTYFSESLAQPTLSTVQAGLLLMQRPDIDSKRLNTQLVDAAYELGLQLDCSSWAIGESEKGLRKRLAWALFMQDKWCSLIHGRPSSISSDNWVVKPLEESDFDAPADGSFDLGRAIFMHMTSLTKILALVLDTFYTPKAMDEVQEAMQGGTRLILERAKPTQIQMKEWFSGLPAQLKLDAASQAGTPSSIGYLHLAYFSTEITLHRCIIRSLNSSTPPSDPYITHICRSAAKTRLISAMDFVNRLRPEHLSAFWYFPSRNAFALIGTFGALLRATAPGQEEADFYATRLREYRWTLGVSARRAPFLQFAMQSLDEAESLLANLPPKPTTKEILESNARERSAAAPANADARAREHIDASEDKDEDGQEYDDDFDVDMQEDFSSGDESEDP